MSLKERLSTATTDAMRGRERERLAVLRLVNAAIKQREVDERIVLDETQTMAVLERMLKQRRDSHAQYAAAGRDDLADQEAYEIGIIQEYLPEPLAADALAALVTAAVAATGAAGMRDMGKVIAHVKDQVAGRADMAAVSALVRQQLTG